METIAEQIVGRLEFGKERYGHGVIVNSDTREWGTPNNSWIEMATEEFLDAIIYVIADYIRQGRQNSQWSSLEIDYKFDEKFRKEDVDGVGTRSGELCIEDDNKLILHILKNYQKIDSPKHYMMIWNLINIILVSSQF
jgi:hypothetical protein|tara:strand:+ start:798 stop:1211 length:414 start_codon:yes stop_codon:yes gene_type:complete